MKIFVLIVACLLLVGCDYNGKSAEEWAELYQDEVQANEECQNSAYTSRQEATKWAEAKVKNIRTCIFAANDDHFNDLIKGESQVDAMRTFSDKMFVCFEENN